MSYFRKWISYLDYYEYGYKKKNAGYVKVWIRGEQLTLEVHMKGLSDSISGFCEIYSRGRKESFLGRFPINQGTGYYNACYQTCDMDKEGEPVWEMEGLTFQIKENCFCSIQWTWENEDVNALKEIGEVWQKKKRGIQKAAVIEEKMTEKEVEAVPETSFKVQKEKEPKLMPKEPEPVSKKPVIAVKEKEKVAPELFVQETLEEDKWQQLCRQYPVCHPFGGQEVYVSIAPKDFIILRKEYQKLVNNSFLLHGYYNYQHIILGKVQEKGKEIFYLGVPGAYYEREKMVAVMFGFEGFEPVKKNCYEEMQKIRSGDFGYYMRKVEI